MGLVVPSLKQCDVLGNPKILLTSDARVAAGVCS